MHVATETDPSDCAYGLAKDSSVGVLVSRQAHADWYPPKPGTIAVSQIRHVANVGEDAYRYYANASAGGIYTADVLTSKESTSVSLAEKAGNAATALAIARAVMPLSDGLLTIGLR